METISINGEEYVKKAEVSEFIPLATEHVCVIADNGWIFEGYTADYEDGAAVELLKAHVVRKWTNGLGIGGLADPAHKDEYTLDELGDVHVYASKVIAVIPLRW